MTQHFNEHHMIMPLKPCLVISLRFVAGIVTAISGLDMSFAALLRCLWVVSAGGTMTIMY